MLSTVGFTYTDIYPFQGDAVFKKHSTMGEAVGIAEKMRAKHVVLTHFSSRYSYTPQLPHYLFEVGNIGLARDFMVARFNELEHLPKLLPLYKQLYQKELRTLDMKVTRREQRTRTGSVS